MLTFAVGCGPAADRGGQPCMGQVAQTACFQPCRGQRDYVDQRNKDRRCLSANTGTNGSGESGLGALFFRAFLRSRDVEGHTPPHA